MNLRCFTLPLFCLTPFLDAQQLLRGKVEDVPSTSTFVLDCTRIPVQSAAFNLNAWVGLEAEMKIANVGPPTPPRLEIQAIAAVAPNFDMGNLKLNQSARWQIRGNAGELSAAWIQVTDATGYLPLGPSGTWLLGAVPLFVNSGTINGAGVFEFNLTMPNLPHLVGTSFTGQGALLAGGNLRMTNPDCRDVRSN